MNGNAENNKNASSFDTDSFASFEKADSSREPSVPFISSGPLNLSSEGSEDTVAPDITNASDGDAVKKTEDGATSFGEGSFASFEGKKSAAQGAGFQPPRDPWNTSSLHQNHGAQNTIPPREERPRSTALDILGWITFFLSFPVGFIGLIITFVSFFVGREGALVLLPMLLLIPVSSIVIGILLNKRKDGKRSGAKNLVIGAIMAFFLGSMLLSCFGEGGFDFDEDPLNEQNAELVEELKGKATALSDIDFSDLEVVYVYDDTEWEGNYKTLDLETYSEEDAENLYLKIKNNPRFLDTVPNELIGLLQAYYRSGEQDFYLVYNLDTEEYNRYPKADGEYNMLSVLVSYYEQTETLYVSICEYKLTYVSSANPPSDF